MNSTERTKKFIEQRKAKGMKELRVWVYPECKALVRRKADIENEKIERLKKESGK